MYIRKVRFKNSLKAKTNRLIHLLTALSCKAVWFLCWLSFVQNETL